MKLNSRRKMRLRTRRTKTRKDQLVLIHARTALPILHLKKRYTNISQFKGVVVVIFSYLFIKERLPDKRPF